MLSIYISLLSYSVSFVKSDWDCLCFWFDILFICILFAFSQICYVFNSFFLLSFHLLCCPFLNTWVEWLMLLKIILLFENKNIQDSLAVQWLGLCVLTAKGLGSVPGQGIKIPQALWHRQRGKQQQPTNKL